MKRYDSTVDERFKRLVCEFYERHARSMPWRDDPEPYRVLVSECMLQQTQVKRVVDKFHEFSEQFPTVEELAAAPLSEVLIAWKGLGYNRRAKFLHSAAKIIVETHDGHVPRETPHLTALPGIGINTAGAIQAYAYDMPAVFIETNIRTVFMEYYFKGRNQVSDAEILPVVERTLDKNSPRTWYWGLMDYGAYLKASGVNHTSRSKHYHRQKPFVGSIRQLRGRIISELGTGAKHIKQLQSKFNDDRLDVALASMRKDGLLESRNDVFRLAD